MSRVSELGRAWVMLAAGAASGCLLFPAPTPMRTVEHRAIDAAHPARCAVVFLPGFGDDEKTFDEHGFVADLRARALSVDTVSAAATFGYYYKRTIVTRLREDVFAPVLARGYEQVWIVGISMGGLGAVLLSRDRAPRIAGLLLLAPYLGGDAIQREITAAGGLGRWQPGPPTSEDDRELWRYLQAVTRTPDRPPTVYFGVGDQDRHRSPGPHPLAAALPPDHLFRTPGGHDWGPWRVLWEDFLDHSEFRARCSA